VPIPILVNAGRDELEDQKFISLILNLKSLLTYRIGRDFFLEKILNLKFEIVKLHFKI